MLTPGESWTHALLSLIAAPPRPAAPRDGMSRYTKGGGGGIVLGGRTGRARGAGGAPAALPRYAVLTAETAEDLGVLVNRALGAGVTLVGGVSVSAAVAYTEVGTLGRVANDIARTFAQAVLYPPGAGADVTGESDDDDDDDDEGAGAAGGGAASPWGGTGAGVSPR